MAVTIQLKDFAPKASPVPADIIYAGNSADSFHEVQITIEDLIAAYPGLLSIGELVTGANEMIYTTAADTYATTSITAFGRSVVALAAGVTTPTAGDLATWDASKNLSANNFLGGFQSIASAAGTTVLTVASPQTTEITGSTTQTVQMPVASTLVAGTPYLIINNSTGAVTVNSSGGNLIQTIQSGTQLNLLLILASGTTAASWQSSYISDIGGVVNIGTANQTAYYAAAGNAVSGVGPGSAGQLYQSAGAGSPPAFTTATYPGTNTLAGSIMRGDGTNWLQSGFTIPDTFAANDLIYCSTTNNLSALSSANNAFLTTNGSGVPSLSKTYLEGTFTPTLVSSGGGTPTYTLQQGQYTQIGNRVYFNINVVLATIGTLASGALTIEALPITPAATCAVSCWFQSLTAGTVTAVSAITNNASQAIALYIFNAGSMSTLGQANLQNTSQFVLSGNYIV